MEQEKSKYVLIIGNGFDLDLGLKTRYKDFYDSKYWPNKNNLYHGGGLEAELVKIAKRQPSWFDIENILKDYASIKQNRLYISLENYLDKDKLFFYDMSKCLTSYLKEVNLLPINRNSIAAKVLSGVINNGNYSIYSFNYTDLKIYAQQLQLSTNFVFDNVHGAINDESIILGVDDETELQNGYNFLYKTFSPHYQSHNLAFDLEKAKEVIFFGHSFANIDYPYFQKFFSDATKIENTEKNSTKITIITYDEQSRIQILSQLRNMNEHRMNYLYNKNDLGFICTKDINNSVNKNKLENLLVHLEETSEQAFQDRVNRLSIF